MIIDNDALASLRSCTDAYLIRGVTVLTGSVLIDRPLSVYRLHGGNALTQTPNLNGVLSYDRGMPSDNDQKGRLLIIDYLIANASLFAHKAHTPFQLLLALKALNDSWPRIPSRVRGCWSYVGGEAVTHFSQLREAVSLWRLTLWICLLGIAPWTLARAFATTLWTREGYAKVDQVSNEMEVILIANGLTGLGEHSYRLVHEVSAALSRRNLRHRVYAAQSLEASIADDKLIRPHFKRSLYDWVGLVFPELQSPTLKAFWAADKLTRLAHTEFFNWKYLNRCFWRDLEALPNDVCVAKNLLVVTAISQNQISGLVDFLLARPPHLQPRVVCQLMFAPNWTPWGRPSRFGDVYYREAFNRAAPLIGRKLFFTTENEAIAEFYRENYGIEAEILPVPFGVAQRPHNAEKTIRLGFFGYSKSDKGFHLLPETAAICRDQGLDVEFIVQVQHSYWERTTIKAVRALRTISNVSLIEGTLSSEAYIAETNKADVVLLPYDPVLFGMRGSGIFTESVAAGRPIIASEGTFAAESIRKGEAQGEVFAPYSAEACAAAIARLLPRISECNARAAAQAEAFARRHSGETYTDVLLKLMASSAGSGQ
ncbi:MAG: glycosyltransferase [Beijerinckiaceae bacterium]